MSHIALDDPPDDLSDIVIPQTGCPFPPFGVSAVLLDLPPPSSDEGWSFVDSFELAMLAACLAGASLLAATLFGADPMSERLVAHVAARDAQDILAVLAGVSLLVALAFAGDGLWRLRRLARPTIPANAASGRADAAAPGARTDRSLATSRAWARRPRPAR